MNPTPDCMEGAVVYPTRWRGMMDPAEREMIRDMTLAEMDKWRLKLVPREMPVEATKDFHGLNPKVYGGFSQDALDYAATIQDSQDPNGLPQHAPGAKNDAGKCAASLLLNFSRALSAVAAVGHYGATKYTRDGWQHVPDGITRYRDAEWRHLLKGKVEECDPESGLPHAWHRLWNSLAVLELELRQQNDENEPCAL